MVWTLMQLAPSAIHYTQNSIKGAFGNSGIFQGKPIGETLDALCDGVTKISDIEQIEVYQKDGRWWSTDNRRLWVFRQYERLGGCDKVSVKVFDKSKKGRSNFTTQNGGERVNIRGDPGGSWHSQPSDTLRRCKQAQAKSREFQVRPHVTGSQERKSIPEWNYQHVESVRKYGWERDETSSVKREGRSRAPSDKKGSSWFSPNNLLLAGAAVWLFNLFK